MLLNLCREWMKGFFARSLGKHETSEKWMKNRGGIIVRFYRAVYFLSPRLYRAKQSEKRSTLRYMHARDLQPVADDDNAGASRRTITAGFRTA